MRCEDALRTMAENEKVDFDVKYYAEKALKCLESGSESMIN